MADGDTIIRIKTEYDGKGAADAKKGVESVSAAAQKTDSDGKTAAGGLSRAWSGFGKTVQTVGRAVGTVTRALGLVGFAVSAVQMAIGAYQKLKDWLDRDKKAAEELARKIQDQKTAAAIEESAKAYERLNAKVAETLRLENERNRLADQRQGQERAAEDAQTELEMQTELASLDRSDPDYAEKADLVRSKYARVRSARSAERARADRITRQTRLHGEADRMDEQAAELERQVNEGPAGDRVIALKGLVHDEEDDERRKKLQAELEKLVADQKKKLAEAKKLRDEAASLRKEAENLFGADRAAQISDRAVNVAQDAADADTRRRIESNRAAREEAEREKRRRDEEAAAKEAAKAAKIAADRETVETSGGAIHGLELTADDERARAQAAADAYRKEQGDVFAAQNRYDMLVANGGSRKERSAALAALQKEQEEANEAKFEMERVAAQVAATLNDINGQIRALSNAVRQAESRLSQNQTDAPEG